MMELNKDNVDDWLNKLDGICEKHKWPPLSPTLLREEWLSDCEGDTPEDAFDEEISRS